MAFKRFIRVSFASLAMFSLIACENSAQLSIVQKSPGAVQIIVNRDNGRPSCVYGLSISHTVNGKIYTDWNIYLNDERIKKCVSNFYYPSLPPEYDLTQKAIPLVAGKAYDVSIVGVGFSANGSFVSKAR